MSRTTLPFEVGDISALAKSLKKASEKSELPPSHVEWLNILARAAGYKNFQHYKADHNAEQRLKAQPQPAEQADHALIEKALRHIGDDIKLLRWPGRASHRSLVLWWIWSLFPAHISLTEKQVNTLLKARNSFGDHAILRRALVDEQFVTRTPDGSRYQRKEMPPEATARRFIQIIRMREKEASN
ncbi:DUF2087 domain-containing protein [uncultured Cohaesibacter sp.]|uniref:DUF2087 domain-containing protein n=1 Tax=uncultured Cohaesibacter sp. TaxID=1002546 RepID=UPI0029C7FAF3|nr:DUF2087 domain-containing protein [uncultured Cohaesibacter sp.]